MSLIVLDWVRVDGQPEFITLRQAAAIAGYASKSTLQTAARNGDLKTMRVGNQHLTTREWLDTYLAHIRQGAYGRGQSRADRDEQPA